MHSLTIGLFSIIALIVLGYSYFGSLKPPKVTDIASYDEKQFMFKDALAMSKISEFIYNVSDNRYRVIIDLINNTVYVTKLRGGLIKANTSATLDLKTREVVSDGVSDSNMLNLLAVVTGENMFGIYDSVFGIDSLRGIRGNTVHTHNNLCTLTDGTSFSFDGEKLIKISRGSCVVESIRY